MSHNQFDVLVEEVNKLNELNYIQTLTDTRALIESLEDDQENDDDLDQLLTNLSQSITKDLKQNNTKLNKFNKNFLLKIDLDLNDYYRYPIPSKNLKLVQNIINFHLLRIGDLNKFDNKLGNQLYEMKSLKDSIDYNHDLNPIINWYYNNDYKDKDEERDLLFEFKLHRLNYLKLMNQNKIKQGLNYSRIWFPLIIKKNQDYLFEISKLMGQFIISNNEENNVSNLDLDFKELSILFVKKFCQRINIEYESFLFLIIFAGICSFPTFNKFLQLKNSNSFQWSSLKELPFETPLPLFLKQYHPIFICPVSKEEINDENPGMSLPCHHIISKSSLLKLSKNGLTNFKCVYCSTSCSLSDCKIVKFYFI
ncbi:hypothetical protein WICMUC_000210 [Wickerhamomyces mucosus]|uniref:RING-Gid-type domain-containing protein n=1 Tax=Wickerhamomyces mucosus TaxID=1378264 RepID=A0A9P8PY74_9ASCO|nr:hypothetical protein WICMUC_000210 [Wickerhamomyces mucosus]